MASYYCSLCTYRRPLTADVVAAAAERDTDGDVLGDADAEKTAATEADTEGVALPDTSADGSALAAPDALTLGVSELE